MNLSICKCSLSLGVMIIIGKHGSVCVFPDDPEPVSRCVLYVWATRICRQIL